jgi:hypothetical protein
MAGAPRLPGTRTLSVIASPRRVKRRSASTAQPWLNINGTVASTVRTKRGRIFQMDGVSARQIRHGIGSRDE